MWYLVKFWLNFTEVDVKESMFVSAVSLCVSQQYMSETFSCEDLKQSFPLHHTAVFSVAEFSILLRQRLVRLKSHKLVYLFNLTQWKQTMISTIIDWKF